MKKYFVFILPAILALFFSCVKENPEGPKDSKTSEKIFDLSGSAQKGPFVNGSDIFIYELDNSFNPTGRSFHTNTDDKGYFELSGLSLVSYYVELLAEGFYFNEVSGELTNEKLSLKAIVDLSAQDDIHINVLTNLEFDRVKKLIKSEGLSISNAKIQAQDEILNVFTMDSVQIEHPESLDIVNSGEGDAILLAISAILQSNSTSSELSKLMADIVLDMKTDGILNDSTIQGKLVGDAMALNMEQVTENLIGKYNELGVVLENINDFDQYVDHFIKNSDVPVISPYEFPASTSNGPNILVKESNKFLVLTDYSFAVEMPATGKIMIKIKRTAGDGLWWYQPMQVNGWKASTYNYTKNEEIFTSTINGDILDLPISFYEDGIASVEYYYNEALIPFFTKSISWGGYNDSYIIFKPESPWGINLLTKPDNSVILSDSIYSISVFSAFAYDINFKLHLQGTVSLEVFDGRGDYTFIQSLNLFEFEFKGENNFADIAFMIHGEGKIELESDHRFYDGTYLHRTYFISN